MERSIKGDVVQRSEAERAGLIAESVNETISQLSRLLASAFLRNLKHTRAPTPIAPIIGRLDCLGSESADERVFETQLLKRNPNGSRDLKPNP